MSMIPIENIVVGKRLRQIRQESVDLLAGSIGEVGLMNPIVVSPILDDEGQETGVFRLIAGNHRLEAYKKLGKTEIPATIGTGSDVDQRLAEIDENLCRAELTHLERAEHLAERKSLYETKYPQTKQGTAGANKRWDENATEIISFASDTAKRTGATDRNIRQAVRRANNISQEVRDSIRDVASIADNSLELDALASLEESEQMAAVRAVLDGKARSIREVVRQKEEATRPQVTIPSRHSGEPEDAAETGDTSVPNGSVDWKRMYKDTSGEVLAQKERIRTLNKERTALKARIKELESSSSEPVPPPASLMAELEEWKRRALEAEERCIYLGHQLDEINEDPVRQSNRGAALKAMLDDLENNLATDPGAFQMETLNTFESRLSDLVFLIKSVKRR
ncbi:MAG: ParB N-terminal domain-containing protein [Magnetococcales bacterium]|nr:ParB N-terminal domain-containing protein [Magnetococcales bacterium]